MIRNKDVVFLEDQTIEDFDKVEKPQLIADDLVDMDPVHFLVVMGEMCRTMVRQLVMIFYR